ncbi:MAG: glycosyltransferase family 4 protein [Paracoccaceae bacterium]
MHILMTANTAWNIWNFRRSVVKAMLYDGHKVTVLAPPDESVARIVAMGCRFVPLEMNVKGLNPLQDFSLMQRFKKHFRIEQPDIILSYTIKNNIFGAIAAKRLMIHFVPNVSGLGTAFLSGRVLQLITEMLYRFAFNGLKVIFFQNPDDRELFLKRRIVVSEQTQLLPGSGIDLNYFSPVPMPDNDEIIFLMIGRLLRDKGIMEFAEAAKVIRSDYPQIRFQVLGAIDAQNRSTVSLEQAESWFNQDILEYLGVAEDVRPHIAAADCVVLPSYREGAPRTLIEASAMARPLITTNVPGCRAVVENGVTGFLCTARSATSLEQACKKLATLSKIERVKMGMAARKKIASEYDEAIVIAAYRATLSTI